MAGRMVSAKEARECRDDWEQSGPQWAVPFAHTVVELNAQLDAEKAEYDAYFRGTEAILLATRAERDAANARADAAEAKLRAVEALAESRLQKVLQLLDLLRGALGGSISAERESELQRIRSTLATPEVQS